MNISPEGFDISTVLMESMILNVPSLNVILDEKIFDYEINKMNEINKNYNILNNKLRDEFFSKISSMELSKREMQLKFLEKVNN